MRNDPGNKDMIQIDSGGGNPPHIGTELIFPYYGMEGTVNKVTSNGANHYNVWTSGGLESRIKEKKDTTIIAYYMSRYAYVVENGELKFYASTPPPAGVTWPVTVARNIIEPPQKNPHEVNVRDDRYQPNVMTIKRGESVTWEWREDPLRSVTSTSSSLRWRLRLRPQGQGCEVDEYFHQGRHFQLPVEQQLGPDGHHYGDRPRLQCQALQADKQPVCEHQPGDGGQALHESRLPVGQQPSRGLGPDPCPDLENAMKHAHHTSSESGSTLVVALGTIGVLIAFVSIAVDYSSNVGSNAQRDRVFNNAVEIGDGCLELAFGSWRKLSGVVEAPPTSTFAAIPTPSPGHFPSFPKATITNFRVQAVDPTGDPLQPGPADERAGHVYAAT